MAILGTIVLIILMAMIVINVFLRNTFNITIVGAVELVEMMMPLIGFLGIAWCALQGGHVVVDIWSAPSCKSAADFDNKLCAGRGGNLLISWYSCSKASTKQIRVVTEA